MKNKLAAFFKGKTFLILFSVVCAVISWLFVLNYTNPIEERTLEIPITVINAESISSYDLVNTTEVIPETANVTVSGRKSIVDNLTSYDFKCYIDFQTVSKTGTEKLKISEPKCDKVGIKIKKYSPSEAYFSFDKKTIVNLNVVVYADDSLLKSGFEFLSQPTPNTETIQVRGFTSDVEKLDHVEVNLNDILEKGSIDSNKSASYIGKYISKNGENVSDKFEQLSVIVSMEVGKTVDLIYSLEGDPKEDYYVNSDSISSGTVTLQGNPAELSRISSVNLGKISVEGASEYFEKELNVLSFLPEGITVYGSSKVTVSVEIQKFAEKTVQYPIHDILYLGKKDIYSYELIEHGASVENIEIVIKGPAEDVESFKKEDLHLFLDLMDTHGNSLPEGFYYGLKLTFRCEPENIEVSGDYIFDVVISEK